MNDTIMHVLAYLSSASSLPTEQDLRSILEQARRNNARDQITGLLLYHDGNFFQALEGPKDGVLACYERIAADPRNHDQIVPMSEDIEARIFADWSMAFVPFAKLNGKDQTGFRDIQRLRDCKPLEPLMQSSEIAIYVKTFLGNFRF